MPRHPYQYMDRIDPDDLNVFQKILLKTDGTLTEILEAYVSENIHVVKLSEKFISGIPHTEILDITPDREVIERKILLQGMRTGKNWLYAESFIIPDRLGINFRNDLITSGIPIGKLWKTHRIETFKEMIAVFREPSCHIGACFGIRAEESLLCRTYRVFSNQKPVMMITEKFPETYYV